MTIFELRDLLQDRDITDLPLRCATYSRVSTEKEEQAASLVNMTDDFRGFVQRNPNWTLVKSYVDDGKSGLTTKKREDFLRLLVAGASGEYDLLITGEISRFGRNTMEGLENIKYLKDRGIPVIFLYDELNTYDPNCDIQIQQKLVDAENESHKISKRVRRGHRKSIQKGHVLGNGMWGYQKRDCRLVIDEETAPIVQKIFELYATNQYSMKQIEQILWDMGYRNSRGNRLSHTTMANIIQNPKYKGYYCGNKVQIIDMMTRRQKFLPEEDWVMYKDGNIPAIVDEELWEKANEVFRRRSKDVKGRRNCSTHQNTYTGKIFCAVDGAPYYCKDVHYKGTEESKWVCSHKIKEGAQSCPSIPIYESDLNQILIDMFREFSVDSDKLLDLYLTQYRELMDDTAHIQAAREKVSRGLAKVEQKRNEMLNLKVEGLLTMDQFRQMLSATQDEEEKLQKELAELNDREAITADLDQRFNKLKAALSLGLHSLDSGVITRDFVDNYISRIDVNPVGDNILELNIQILTSETIQCRLETVSRGRTGHTFKKMIEAYENGMK